MWRRIWNAILDWPSPRRLHEASDWTPPRTALERLATPPAALAAVYDLGPGELPRWTIVLDSDTPDYWRVVRFTDSLDSAWQEERVHKALLNIHTPEGHMEFHQLPRDLQRHIANHFYSMEMK